MALGNIQRGRKEFAECADTYCKAIATIAHPEKSNWILFYFRGICYERSHQWPKAEADMKKALELFPDQPLVLNYLGYSWVDQGIHLDDGMDMIRKRGRAASGRRLYRQLAGLGLFPTGNYDEAVKNLERAVELKPEDPTINDHLGDAYWRVGRTLEAHFQWSHAKDLEPGQRRSAEDRGQDQRRAARRQQQGHRRRRMPTRRRNPATAAERKALPVSLARSCAGQGQSDAAGAWPPQPTAITRSKAWWCSPASAIA